MSNGIEYTAHTEAHDGIEFVVQRWGTSRAFIEECDDVPGQLHIYVPDQSDKGNPTLIPVELAHLLELYLVLEFFLMNWEGTRKITTDDLVSMTRAGVEAFIKLKCERLGLRL